MSAFIVDLPNRPGSLADVGQALGERGVNITAAAGATSGDTGTLAFTADNDGGARAVLDGRGWTYREVDTVNAALDHVPGSLGAAARSLADAGVNIETAFASGMEGNKVVFVFGVSDAGAARAALGDAAVG